MAGSVYEGKTFDEAVRKGLEALRLTRAEAVITTVEEGKGGFLGIGSRPFKVSVARRPGGAIKEPAEREDRGNRRTGGREERGGRGGRGGREERAGRSGGERPARGGRDERPAKEERAASGDRPAREERPERGGRGRRDERPAREERAPREERVAREDRAPREERGPREERRPAPVQSSPVPPAVAADEGDDSPRKRRRRGRRGGRGRRRGGPGGEGEHEGAPEMAGSRRESASAPPASEPAPMAPAAVTPPPAPVRVEPVRMEPAFSEPVRVEPVAPAPAPVEAEAFASAPVMREERAPREEHAPREERAPRPERSHREERPPRRAPSEGSPELTGDDLLATSRKITEDLLRAMGFEPKVAVKVDGDRVDVTVEVERDGELLNGRQGETRQALQHLLNRFLNKGDGSRYHLQLEVNDYWLRREAELAELAKQMADDAVARNTEVVTGYLNSQERRMIHVTLKEDARVRTFSLGDGMLKRVAVAPADFPERTEDDHAS